MQVWWPSFDQPVYVDRCRCGTAATTVDPDTGEVLPTWEQALDQLDADPDAQPGACAAVRRADRHAGHHRPVRRRGPGDPLPDEVPDQRRSPTPTPTDDDRPTRPICGTSTGCTPNCGACRARRGVRTGSATASNPPTPALACDPGIVRSRPMTGPTSASAAAASWSPGSGPARPWPNTRPTARPWSAKPCSTAGVVAPEVERMAATVTLPDGSAAVRLDRHQTRPDDLRPGDPAAVLERQRWRAQYEARQDPAACG